MEISVSPQQQSRQVHHATHVITNVMEMRRFSIGAANLI